MNFNWREGTLYLGDLPVAWLRLGVHEDGTCYTYSNMFVGEAQAGIYDKKNRDYVENIVKKLIGVQ